MGNRPVSPGRAPGNFGRPVGFTRWLDGAAQRFLSQPFSVAQVFTGRECKQVSAAETVRGFKEILEGKHDALAEGDFYMKDGIDEVKRT